jgi:hypothetical protein
MVAALRPTDYLDLCLPSLPKRLTVAPAESVTEYWNRCDPGGQAPASTVVAEQAAHRVVVDDVLVVLQVMLSTRVREEVRSPSCAGT